MRGMTTPASPRHDCFVDKGTTGRAEITIAADPNRVYEVVSDVTRMGEWSPECVEGRWLDGATGPVVGARFQGRNKHGRARWSNKPFVTAAERGREFSFVVRHLGRDMTKWTYRFEPASEGTRVVESFEMLNSLPFCYRLTDRFVMGVKDRKADLEANMRRTLESVKGAIEEV